MKLDIRGLEVSAPEEEKALAFERAVNLASVTLWGEHPYPHPVQVTGKVVNRGNFYELAYRVDCLRAFRCARCTKTVEREVSQSFSHVALESDEDPFEVDAFIPVSGGIIDLERMVTDDLLLSLEGSDLCEPDCPGICPVCGGTPGVCGCSTSPPDPRFDVIRKLLENEPH